MGCSPIAFFLPLFNRRLSLLFCVFFCPIPFSLFIPGSSPSAIIILGRPWKQKCRGIFSHHTLRITHYAFGFSLNRCAKQHSQNFPFYTFFCLHDDTGRRLVFLISDFLRLLSALGGNFFSDFSLLILGLCHVLLLFSFFGFGDIRMDDSNDWRENDMDDKRLKVIMYLCPIVQKLAHYTILFCAS